MKRREFFNSVIGIPLVMPVGNVSELFSMALPRNISDNREFSGIDPIIPFRFYQNREEYMLKQIIELNKLFGYKRFLITAPMDDIRLKGFPEKSTYREIGELILRIKRYLSKTDIQIGWWCAPSIRIGHGPYQPITGIDGSTPDMAPCPLDKDFCEFFSSNIAEVVSIAHPFMVQIEDDFNLSNQGPVKFGCFCPLHLQEFSERQNRYYSREDLMNIFSETNSESIRLRREWAKLSRDSLARLALSVSEKVRKADADVRICLCQVGSASFDGEFTESVARAFAGHTRPMVRINSSVYGSDDSAQPLPGLFFTMIHYSQHLPDDIELIHEADTYPHTRFYMSALQLKSLMTIAFASGFNTSLFYTTQYLDNPLEENGYNLMFLKENKRFGVLKQTIKNCTIGGCEISFDPEEHFVVPYNRQSKNRPYARRNPWIDVIGSFGIPQTTKDGKVKMIAGNATEIKSDEEIKNILSGSVFLDGQAAFNLSKRGFGNLIGAEVLKGAGANFCYEGVRKDVNFIDVKGDLMYNLIFAPSGSEGGAFYQLLPSVRAEVLTDFLDPEEKPAMPGMVRFENDLGGRVAITAFDLARNHSSAIFNYKKKEIIRQTIEWLGKEQLPVFVKYLPNVYCLFNRSRDKDFGVVVLVNLCSDPVDSFFLEMAEEWIGSDVFRLDQEGRWKSVSSFYENRLVHLKVPLYRMDPLILKLIKR